MSPGRGSHQILVSFRPRLTFHAGFSEARPDVELSLAEPIAMSYRDSQPAPQPCCIGFGVRRVLASVRGCCCIRPGET